MYPITLYSLTSLTELLSEARRGEGMFVFGGSQWRWSQWWSLYRRQPLYAATQKDKNNTNTVREDQDRLQQPPATSSMAFRRMQSLVGAAGEALGLTEDPLTTLVGLRIEETVDDDLDIENWDQSNSDDADICDLILNTPGGELQAVRALKKK